MVARTGQARAGAGERRGEVARGWSSRARARGGGELGGGGRPRAQGGAAGEVRQVVDAEG